MRKSITHTRLDRYIDLNSGGNYSFNREILSVDSPVQRLPRALLEQSSSRKY